MFSRNKALGFIIFIIYTAVNFCRDRLGNDKIVSFLDHVRKSLGSALLSLKFTLKMNKTVESI